MEFEPSKEDLAQFREWLSKMPHLIQDYDDEFLAAFIRSRKGSLQKAKERLESFNGLGMKYPEICGSLDPLHPQLQENLSRLLFFPLSKKTKDDCTVFFASANPEFPDASKSHMFEFYRYILLSIYVLIWEKRFGSGKTKFFTDTKYTTLGDVKDITPASAKKMTRILVSGFPLRFQFSALLNVPPGLEFIINLFKLFVKKKLGDRMQCIGNMEDISEIFPVECLPKEYGGCEESVFVLHENWKKKIESYRERFLEEERKMRKLDPLRPKTDDEDEMAGTFKQLTVD